MHVVTFRRPLRCCRLELQARNNSKLLVALEELLDRLSLPEDTEQLLVQANFDINRCRVCMCAL